LYSHDPERFEEFGRRYREELKDAERAQVLQHLEELAESGTLTLLTATRHAEISEAAVLADLIGDDAVWSSRVSVADRQGGLDECGVGQGLGVVAEVAAGPGVDLLG